MRRRGTPALVASPVLVGSVTLLVVLVGVFLAYNANAGLPFVPTYDLRAELSSAGKLVRGNEVRVGGFRVGAISKITPGKEGAKATAVIDMKLDKTIEPLAADTTVRVRPRSPLGIKYVELQPGRSKRTLVAGSTLPLRQGSVALEFEDVYATFGGRTRRDVQRAAQGMGDAFSARGPALNEAIAATRPLLVHMTPVMRTLSAGDTRLGELVRQLGATMAELAPVPDSPGATARWVADTMAALNRSPEALAAVIERAPPTLADVTSGLRATRPLLVESTDLVRRLRPAAAVLPETLPRVDSALRAGTPVLGDTVRLSRRLATASRSLRALVREPNTLLTVRGLGTSLQVLRPALKLVAPYQTVCNYTMYFFVPLGEHLSEPAPGGVQQPQLVKITNQTQPNGPAFTLNSRPWDLPPGQPAQGAMFNGQPAGRAMGSPFQRAIDPDGKADCQNGQNGYPNGSITEPFFDKADGLGVLSDGTPKGGNAAVAINDYPGRSGGTFKSRELGIDDLDDVP